MQIFDASFFRSLSLNHHLSLHCRIEDEADGEEEDEEEVGVGGQVGQVDLEESLRHGLAQDVARHTAVDTWKKVLKQHQKQTKIV